MDFFFWGGEGGVGGGDTMVDKIRERDRVI